MGADIDAAVAEEQSFEVWDKSATSLDAWFACATQWRAFTRRDGAMIWLGLDYAGVDVALRRLEFDNGPRLFGDLQLMEQAALAAFGEM